MNILIINPDEKEAELLEQQIRFVEKNCGKRLNTYLLADSKGVLLSRTKFDIAVIATDIDGASGLELGKALLNKASYTKLIFISDNYDKLDNCFDISAVRYLVRPLDEKRFCSGVAEAVSRIETETVTINLKSGFNYNRINIKDIIYIEIVDRKTRIVTTKGVYTSNHPLAYWREKLCDYDFVSTHISFLVNMKYITEYRRNRLVVLKGSHNIPISRSRGPSFHNCYLEYCSK